MALLSKDILTMSCTNSGSNIDCGSIYTGSDKVHLYSGTVIDKVQSQDHATLETLRQH
jgi:hypothetical protein